MANDEIQAQQWPRIWVRYPKHRKATIRAWRASHVRTRTAQKNGESQYDPEVFGTDDAVQALETMCLEDGILISETKHRKTFYMRDPQDRTVGMCCGVSTEYVFVEWLDSGEYHGRPTSTEALKRLGVDV